MTPSTPPPAGITGASDLGTLIAALEAASSAEDLVQATRVLAGSRQPGAAGALVKVLGFNNPGAAVMAVDGLIAIGSAAVPLLLGQLDPRNYGARAWAVRALAGIGDVRGLELLEEALATDVGPSVRRAAACGLGRLELETLPADGRRAVQERCLAALEAALSDGEWVVRYAVAVGLESLGCRLADDAHGLGRTRRALGQLLEPADPATPVVELRARLALNRLPAP